MRTPSRSTSPPVNRRFPFPPPAAPAAGGWGNPVSLRVHSVGSGRSLAGGVLEAVACRRRVLLVVFDLSGGGARRSFMAEHRLLRARGPRWPPCAFPALELVAASPVEDLNPADVGARRRGGRRSRMEAPRSSRTGDFPSARGHPPIQGSREDAVEAHRRNVLFFVGVFVLQKGDRKSVV